MDGIRRHETDGFMLDLGEKPGKPVTRSPLCLVVNPHDAFGNEGILEAKKHTDTTASANRSSDQPSLLLCALPRYPSSCRKR